MSKDNQKMTGDSVYRVKMYKDGKRWVYAGATTLALAAGLVFANVNASADTAASSDATTEQVSSAASSAATSSTATSSAATDASSASSTATSTSSTASSTATTSSSAASSTASSAATSTTSAASSSAATVSATTPASSDATSTSTATVAATAAKASVATPASAAATATTTATTTAATTAPTVTAPASEAANQTAAGSVDAGTLTSATQSGGSGNLQDQAQYIQENVDGTNIKVTAGHTYAVAIRLTKSQALDWANASGQVSIAPNGSNSNGTWTAVEYATESGKEYSYAAGASTATVDITKLTDADSYVTVLYTFKANDDATTGSRAAYLEFTGTTSVNKLSTNTNNTDANQQIEAWSYATQVMDTSVAAGTVVAHYVDENGNKIADDTTVQGDVDNTYTVTPATFSNYTLDTTKSSALTGTVAADTTDSDGNVTAAGTELTLVYSQNTEASNLTVNYVDADGNTILPSKTYTEGADGTAAEVGGAYSVNAASIDGYTLTGDATQTGTFVSGGNTVTFTYTKDAAPVEQSTVTVNYVDADGNTIKAATTQTLDNGSTYTVETPTIDGYTYKSADAALTGTVDGNKTITLTYTKNATPVEQSTVTVNYVDADGNTIKAATTQTLDNGSTYTVETPTIDGYTYKPADAALTGTVDGNKTITLTYTKDSTTPVENKANLTINYVDADGNTIKASSVTEYIVGQAYTVGQPEIAGYTYDHATGDAIAGTIAYNGNTVTLVYTKNGGTTPTEQTKTITVNYVDADGNTIKSATTTTYKVGDTYTVATPSIDGYTYKSADGALSGTVADDATITLTYAKNDNGGSTTAPTTAPGTGDNGNNGGGTTTTAPTTAPGTGDNVNGGGTGTTTTAPVTTPSDDTVDNGNGSSNNGSSTTTSTAPATTVSDDEVTPTTTATTNNGTSGVVPASASLKPVVTTKTTTSDAKTLPQTDEDENGTALAVLGLSTLLMGSALYFGVSRRKHEA
ncbi:MucBP domain-containing protein [Lactiplantibacillus plantarum]|uniref:MucBP domain-containing protein n=1 Tax=Lactiplantibacillus plantarum TaxID=1590 RepID=UPI001D0866BB|nr:MucBP domain-containing protein [Lactiplantibacillus plantarum]MCB7139987.1 MucBP domain-containing protein [Lactiplantibacillus plantarum]MCB7156229.1 MucBP domain-containing protein [Lactiplantibacillus plantarum]MCB7165838.1 MucBP domain-containing protein [Lactiplantibacillus plantarum]MCB7166245.1 MucBP domain-containing protein [Lactiplantibacillus plantarum]MCB7172590.1 MucBP domain-containing protein [Lactiplantibacillus plantarum]